MDPRDDLDSLAGGVGCAACGEIVPGHRIRILARRDDLVFLEVTCPACRSESLGIVVTTADEESPFDADAATLPIWGEFDPDDVARFRDASPIAPSDVETVRRLLATGGLAALVGEPPASGPAR
jgi:hypothetical protein